MTTPQQEPVGEWRMKNGEPMHVLWRSHYKPQLGDKLYAAPPAAPADPDSDLAFVERWAVHHVKTQGAEAAIGVIANYPPIRAITKSLGDDTPAAPADDEAVRLLRKARKALINEPVLEAAIDAYLAKVK